MCLVYTSITAPHTTRLHWEDRFVRWFGNELFPPSFCVASSKCHVRQGCGCVGHQYGVYTEIHTWGTTNGNCWFHTPPLLSTLSHYLFRSTILLLLLLLPLLPLPLANVILLLGN